MQYQELLKRLEQECTANEVRWFQEKIGKSPGERKIAFVMTHRFVGQVPIGTHYIKPHDAPYEIDLSGWTRDQLVRTLFLLSLDEGNKDSFVEMIEELFQTADNREAQAIYAAIPFFNYAPVWTHRATEAIRSNVGLIFDAMAFNNPYPAMYFDDAAWNQLVLKTIFNDKSIWNILGIGDRRNEALAASISDFAHERWAAGRTLPPEVWFLTSPYPDERFWQDTYHLLSADREVDRKAGYLLWKNQFIHTPENFTESFRPLLEHLDSQSFDWENLETSA